MFEMLLLLKRVLFWKSLLLLFLKLLLLIKVFVEG